MEEQKLKSKFPGAPGVFFGYWVQDYFNLSNNQEGGIFNAEQVWEVGLGLGELGVTLLSSR